MVVMSCFRYMGYKKNSHFMIDVLNLKLRFVTDVLTGSIFFHSNLNLLMEFLYFTG